jgi:hypothetical protein
MLVLAYATSLGKAKWSGPHHTIKMWHFVLFHNVACCTISIVSRIHVNTTKLRNITCSLVAIGVILQSLECTLNIPISAGGGLAWVTLVFLVRVEIIWVQDPGSSPKSSQRPPTSRLKISYMTK